MSDLAAEGALGWKQRVWGHGVTYSEPDGGSFWGWGRLGNSGLRGVILVAWLPVMVFTLIVGL